MKELCEHAHDGFGMSREKATVRFCVKIAMTLCAKGHEVIHRVIPHSLRDALPHAVNMVDCKFLSRTTLPAGVPVTRENGGFKPFAESLVLFHRLIPVMPFRASFHGLQSLFPVKFVLAGSTSVLRATSICERKPAICAELLRSNLGSISAGAIFTLFNEVGALVVWATTGVAIFVAGGSRLEYAPADRARLRSDPVARNARSLHRARLASLREPALWVDRSPTIQTNLG